MKRENISEYPMKALKEAVANALIHRDYSLSRKNAYIYVQIYDDRLDTDELKKSLFWL